MQMCAICRQEIPVAVKEIGGRDILCGQCLKASQKLCQHVLLLEDNRTCRDCGARPVTMGRIVRSFAGGVKSAVVGIVKLFVIYTIPSILGSAVTLGILYYAGKKAGLLP